MSDAHLERLRLEMMDTGNRLSLAMKAEQDFNSLCPREHEPDLQRQWIESRHIVNELAEDYIGAIARWRAAIQDCAGRGTDRDRQGRAAAPSGRHFSARSATAGHPDQGF